MTNAKCEEFAAHFMNKIHTIRSSFINLHFVDFNRVESLPVLRKTLDIFVLVDAEMITKVISQAKAATCLLDPIPTPLFKSIKLIFLIL